MKKLMIAMVLLFAFSAHIFVFADEPMNAENSSQEIKTFTVDQAMEYALNNRQDLQAARSNMTKFEVMLNEAKSAFNIMQNKSANVFDNNSPTSFVVKKGLKVKMAEVALDQSKKDLALTEAKIKYNVQSAFYTYLSSADKVTVENNNLLLAQKKLEESQLKYNQGYASDFDVLTMKNNVTQQNYNLEKSKRAAELASYNLKNMMGIDLKENINFTGKLELPDMPDIQIDQIIKENLMNRYEGSNAFSNYELSKEAFRVTALWYEPNTYAYSEAKHAVDVSYYLYLNALNSVELSIRNCYDNLKNAYGMIEVTDSNLNLSKTALDIVQKKYDLGLATSTEVSDAFQKVCTLETNKTDVTLSAYLALIIFQSSYSIGMVQ